jgi:hypothetical protein
LIVLVRSTVQEVGIAVARVIGFQRGAYRRLTVTLGLGSRCFPVF